MRSTQFLIPVNIPIHSTRHKIKLHLSANPSIESSPYASYNRYYYTINRNQAQLFFYVRAKKYYGTETFYFCPIIFFHLCVKKRIRVYLNSVSIPILHMFPPQTQRPVPKASLPYCLLSGHWLYFLKYCFHLPKPQSLLLPDWTAREPQAQSD